MSKYRITLNGKAYEMEIERIDGSTQVQTKSASPAAKSVESPKSVSTPVLSTPPIAPAAGGNVVVSPMPGTILKVYAALGDAVKKGQPVMVLEAMKMENEIVSPRDGSITAIHVSQGDAVQGGAVLLEIGE